MSKRAKWTTKVQGWKAMLPLWPISNFETCACHLDGDSIARLSQLHAMSSIHKIAYSLCSPWYRLSRLCVCVFCCCVVVQCDCVLSGVPVDCSDDNLRLSPFLWSTSSHWFFKSYPETQPEDPKHGRTQRYASSLHVVTQMPKMDWFRCTSPEWRALYI